MELFNDQGVAYAPETLSRPLGHEPQPLRNFYLGRITLLPALELR